MNPAQYAKRIGTSRQYVHKLIQQGKLTLVNGKIDTALADTELQLMKAGSHAAKGRALGSRAVADAYKRALTRCANARARRLELELRKRKNELLPAAEVQAEWERLLALFKTRLRAMGRHLALTLGDVSTPHEREAMILDYADDLLRDLSGRMADPAPLPDPPPETEKA